MKQIRRGTALLLAGAMLASLPAVPFAAPAVAAAAAGVETIQTRVFRYDFGGFAALYDTRSGKWYEENGTRITAKTETQQQWNSGGLTVDFEQNEAYRTAADGSKAVNSRITAFLQESLSAFVPDYAAEYYDKAQQKNIAVPVPESFPLTYRVLPDAERFSIEVMLGEHSLGQFTDGDDFLYEGDGTVGYGRPDAFTDAGDLTVDGSISIADAICSSRIAAEDQDVKISPLGLELADEDGDGMVGIGDVRALLHELVSPNTRPYLTQVSNIGKHEILRDFVYEEEINVVPVEGDDFFTTDYRSLNGTAEQMAQAHGYGCAAEMFHLFKEEERSGHFLASCVPGEQYDKWYLSFFDTENTYKYLELGNIKVSDAGLLSVSWYGLESRSDEQGYNSFTHILTMEHGLWDEIKGYDIMNSSFSVCYAADQEESFSAEVGKILTVTRCMSGQKIPADAIPVVQDIRETVAVPDPHIRDASVSGYREWIGKDDFVRSLALTDDDWGISMSVLPKDDAIQIYTHSVNGNEPRDCRVAWVSLDGEGKLTVGIIADLREDAVPFSYGCGVGAATVFSETLLLPAGTLSADAVSSVKLQADPVRCDINTILANCYFHEPWDASKGEYPLKLALLKSGSTTIGAQELPSEIIRNEVLHDRFDMVYTDPGADGSVTDPVGFTSQNGMIERIAKQHGYATGTQMAAERLSTYDTDRHIMIDCKKGEEYDQWYLSRLFEDEQYAACRITGMNLSDDGKLTVTWGLLSGENAEENAFSQVLTVKHGIWDQIRTKAFQTELYDAADAEQYAEFCALAGKPLTLSRGQQTKSVSVLTHEHEKLLTDDIYQGTTSWDGQEDWLLAKQTLKDKKDSMELAVLPKQDALNIYFTDYAWSKEYGIESLNLNEDGELTVTVALYPYSDEMYETVFADYLTLPKFSLPEDAVKSVKLKVRNYLDPYDEYVVVRGEQWAAFQAAVPEQLTLELSGIEPTGYKHYALYPAAGHQVLRDQYQVMRSCMTTQDENGEVREDTMITYNSMTGGLAKTAELHKFEKPIDLITALDQMPSEQEGVKFLVSCEEGETYDKWILSFFFEKRMWNRCEISDLSITNYTGSLSISLSLLNDRETNGLPFNVFTHILTMPHGLFHKEKGYWLWTKEYDETQRTEFEASFSDPPVLKVATTRMGPGVMSIIGLEHGQEKLENDGILKDWDGKDDFLRASQTLSTKTEWKVGDTVVGSAELSVLKKDDELKLYITGNCEEVSWSSCCGIEELYLDPYGKLTVTAGFYPDGDQQYAVLFAETVKLPDNGFFRQMIRSVELVPHFYKDTVDSSSGSAVIHGEQWEAFQEATKYIEFTAEGSAGAPIADVFR